MKTDRARTLDTYEAEFLNENPPRREEVAEIQFEESGELICYANPEKAPFITLACNHHEELVEALEFLAPRIGSMLGRLRYSNAQDAEMLPKIQSLLTKLKG